LTPRQVSILSAIGLFVGLVLILVGYSRYYSACFPNGPIVPVSCNYPSQPIDIAIDTVAITLILISGALLLMSLLRPSAFKRGDREATEKGRREI